MWRPVGPAQQRVGATGRLVQNPLELDPNRFHGVGIRIRRHPDRFNAHQRTASKRQIDRRMIPIIQPNETTRRHCKGHDRPPRFPRQHDDAKTRDARTLRHVGGQRNIITLFKRPYHFLEGADPALAVESRTMVAGTSDRADAEALGRNRVKLAVAVPRDQYLGPVAVLGLDEGREEMLAVPERKDARHVLFGQIVDIAGFVNELVGSPNQPKVFGGKETQSALNPAAAQPVTNQSFQLPGFVSCPGSSSRWRWTTK